MRRLLGWMTVVLLCCAAGGASGEETPDARLQEAQAAFDEATRLKKAGAYAEAHAPAQQALTLREAVLGPAHLDVARCLNLLGELYWRQGDLAHAEPLYARTLALREAALGPNHLGVAAALIDLANVYADQASFDRAEPLYARALAIREAALDPNHPDIARALNNLAALYFQQARYPRAEALYLRALPLLEAALDKNHPDIAQTLDNLALLYWEQGAYDRVEPLLQRALALQEAALGGHHPDVAQTLLGLAGIHEQQKAYRQAEPLFQRALALQEAALGENHPNVAQTLNNLASFYSDQGDYARARPLLQRALRIWETTLGKQHPYVAQSLVNLAVIDMNQGVFARARLLLQRALALQEEVLGPHHPGLVWEARSLALVRLAQHRLTEALPLFTRAFTLSEQRLRQEALDFSEPRLANFLHALRADEQLFYTLLRMRPEDARVRRLALSALLLLKGRSAEEMASISRTLYRSLGPEDRVLLERLRGLRTQQAALSFAGPGELPPADYQRRLQALAGEGEALETDLARRSAPLRALTALPPPAEIVDRVAASLPRDSALVDFVSYADHPLILEPGAPSPKTPGPLRYLALVLFPDGSTRAVDLGPAGPIDSAASSLRTALAHRSESFEGLARRLHERVFQPLLPVLGSTRRLFLCPEGQLGLVPFAALHDGKGFLLDSFDFIYLASGRELLPPPGGIVPASSVFVLADPTFTAAPPGARSGAAPSRKVVGSEWLPLPGTRREAEDIQGLLPQAQLFLGAEATKERLLRLPTPGILHLATHGFFLEDVPAVPGTRAVGYFGELGDHLLAAPPAEPLLRSGLALASPPDSAPDALKDSLVTALELAGLDLWGTQLVVLSACDTGRGDIKLGQGVYGLRRALGVAGAETVVMSLWQVQDDSTRRLMEGYYRNLLAGQGRASALREAMRSLRAALPHPHDWAPFIALGSDAPLRGITPTAPAP